MGNTQSIRKINFEDMQCFIYEPNVTLISTLPEAIQDCLIVNTVQARDESNILNDLLNQNIERKIVLYGMNSSDEVIVIKYNQLTKLGFCNVYVYVGGLFEWLILQDIYGDDSFPTTKKELDILRFKGSKMSARLMITYL